MATVQELKATARPKGGKGAARSARRSGKVPGVIYGENKPPVMVLLEHDELRKRIYAGRFLTTLYNLDVDGTKHRVIPRDFQLDAIKDLPMHVDFLRVSEGATIRVHIPVHVLNADQAPGVKRGGAVNIVTHTVQVICPADAIPESIDVDISGLDINCSKHLNEVTLPPNSATLFYLQRLRDEAHRFAIGTHRAKRAKSLTTSTLDEVPGIGPNRKRALLMHFGTARAVKGAALDDLEKAPGISRATARQVYDYFHPRG